MTGSALWTAFAAGFAFAAFAALAANGPYRTACRYYRAAPELLAGFAVRTALPVGAAR